MAIVGTPFVVKRQKQKQNTRVRNKKKHTKKLGTIARKTGFWNFQHVFKLLMSSELLVGAAPSFA